MDEPLGALDRQLREQMQYEIRHIHERTGVTVVYVTHDQSEALTMSNRIAVLNHGRIQRLATPQDLYERPENAFAAQFIGESNRLLGTVREVNGHTCVVEVEGGAVRALAINVDGAGSRSTPVAPPGAGAARPRTGVLPEPVRGAGRGADLPRRPHAHAGLRLRLRRLVIKVPNAVGQMHLAVGAAVRVGWQTEDCRALDVA